MSGLEARSSRLKGAVICVVMIAFVFSFELPAFCSDKWSGVDEAVVEKIAKEHGREAKKPLLNTDQGDMLLFVFLLAGAVGGFAAGYCWRMLVVEKSDKI